MHRPTKWSHWSTADLASAAEKRFTWTNHLASPNALRTTNLFQFPFLPSTASKDGSMATWRDGQLGQCLLNENRFLRVTELYHEINLFTFHSEMGIP